MFDAFRFCFCPHLLSWGILSRYSLYSKCHILSGTGFSLEAPQHIIRRILSFRPHQRRRIVKERIQSLLSQNNCLVVYAPEIWETFLSLSEKNIMKGTSLQKLRVNLLRLVE